MTNSYVKPLDNLTLSFYIPPKKDSKTVIIKQLQYNNTFFNIDYLNNYFAYITIEDVDLSSTDKLGISIVNMDTNTNHQFKQYILHIIRIIPGVYNTLAEIVQNINNKYKDTYTYKNMQKQMEDNEEGTVPDLILNFNEDDPYVTFSQEIIPVIINFTDDIKENTKIKQFVGNETAKTSNIILFQNGNLKKYDGDSFINQSVSYNNYGFNKDISLFSFISDTLYTVNINNNNTVKLYQGTYVNEYCFLDKYIYKNEEAIDINTMDFITQFNAEDRLVIDKLHELNIYYSYTNNISELVTRNIDTFNIIKKNLPIANSFKITVNKKIPLSSDGLYIYITSSEFVIEILTNSACKLFYSYI